MADAGRVELPPAMLTGIGAWSQIPTTNAGTPSSEPSAGPMTSPVISARAGRPLPEMEVLCMGWSEEEKLKIEIQVAEEEEEKRKRIGSREVEKEPVQGEERCFS